MNHANDNGKCAAGARPRVTVKSAAQPQTIKVTTRDITPPPQTIKVTMYPVKRSLTGEWITDNSD